MSDSLQLHRLYCPWNSPGQNTGVGDLSLFQRIFPTQRSRSPALQADSLPTESQGKGSRLQVISVSLVLSRSHRRCDNYVNVEVVMNALDILRVLQRLSCEWFLMIILKYVLLKVLRCCLGS